MTDNPGMGVMLHAIGGLAAASFYLPFKRVRDWSWETYWLVNGVFSWILAPWIVALLTTPDVLGVLRETPLDTLGKTYLFGVLWGIGGLTFGLSMRYLGMSLGYALALGFCAAFGTLVPPIVGGQMPELLRTGSGLTTMAGIGICLLGIAVCGRAGVAKERELPAESKQATIREFNFAKGVWVAAFAGVMSACMAFGISAGQPIAELALRKGTPALWQNSPVFIVILAGGFTTNCIWCLLLNRRNKSGGDYLKADAPLLANYIFSAMAGVTWFFQFMFYGMGTTKMGDYDFSSWTIHMAFIIVFSNIWGILFKEWKGTSRRTHNVVFTGILVLVFSTMVVGYGTYLKSAETEASPAPATQAATGELH